MYPNVYLYSATPSFIDMVMDRLRHTIIYVFQHDDVTCHLTFILGNILFLLLRTYYIGEAAVNLLHMTIDNVIYT